MGKSLTDADPVYENQSRSDPKRPHQWYTDPNEDLFPNKKQAVETVNNKPNPEILSSNAPLWESPTSYSQVPNQFMDRLFGSEHNRTFNLTEHNVFPVVTVTDDLNMASNDQYGNDPSVGLSMSHAMVDPETCLSYGGIRRVKVNQVKDSDNGGQALVQAYNTENETNFLSVGQVYDKEDENVVLMGHTFNKGDDNIRTIESTFMKEDENGLSFDHSYNKEQTNTLSFGGFSEDPHIDPLAQPLNSCEPFYDQSSAQASDMPNKRGPKASNPGATKAKSEALSNAKAELKGVRKEAPNSFPSNVKSLISTGMLDGVPVKYVSLSREEHRGIIKGNGYLCGCRDCNFSKALNAYRFESHAGSKTKHPNNHIYFESGKTIYQIVQELKTTPESQLFNAIQTVTGSPINQKAFRTWKESYQAATRELQRIYGKEGLN